MSRIPINKIFLLVALTYISVELFIWPSFQHAMNDDWAYALAVKDFLQNSHWHYSFWQAIPAFPQLLIGILASKVSGFSFVTLRITSVICLLFSLYIFDKTLRKTNIAPSALILLLLIFTFQPVTFLLSNSFMPESVITFMSVLSLYCMIIYWKGMNGWFYAAFIIFSILTVLSRQSSIVIPLAYLFADPYKTSNWRMNLLRVLPLLLSFTALMIFQSLVQLPANYGLQFNAILHKISSPDRAILLRFVYHAFNSICLLGLMLVPFSIGYFPLLFQNLLRGGRYLLLLGVLILLVFVKWWWGGHAEPNSGNMFYWGGIGPVIMDGLNTDIQDSPAFWKTGMNLILSLIGILSFVGSLFAFITFRVQTSLSKAYMRFMTILSLLYITGISINFANDRYLIFLVPFLLLGFAISGFELKWRPVCFFAVAIMIIYTVLGTSDQAELLKGREVAEVHMMKDLGVLPCDMDGGFEFNAYHCSALSNLYDPYHRGKWWWVRTEDHLLSLTEKKGYVCTKEIRVHQWLRPDLQIHCLTKEIPLEMKE